jgi:hypothetical protein
MDTGMDEASANRWCDAWELEAMARGLAKDADDWPGQGVDPRGAGGASTGL